ncbi:class I SAM-dependent methyltransferase [Streptomyces sp. NPDC102283]|uniref:class I SAM-dependent methyltransferase n=1 Tax=Streptomyces sp. NPDC102283 TaxID=3366155 RepID=UPI0037F857BE
MLGETARTWLRRWDQQQERYSPDREERFQVVIDIVGRSLDRSGTAARPLLVDLGCGTGSLTTRLAGAFPRADTVGVDADPLLLGLAEEAVTGTDLRLLARDLAAPGWADDIGPAPWDAAVSSTALHWLAPDELAALYRTLAGRLRPGGVFVDADNRRPADDPELVDIARHVRARRAHRTGRQGSEAWAGWWKTFLSAPELAPLAEARARSPIAHRTFREPHGLTTADQITLLREAGFSGAATVWQCGDDSVLVAVR